MDNSFDFDKDLARIKREYQAKQLRFPMLYIVSTSLFLVYFSVKIFVWDFLLEWRTVLSISLTYMALILLIPPFFFKTHQWLVRISFILQLSTTLIFLFDVQMLESREGLFYLQIQQFSAAYGISIFFFFFRSDEPCHLAIGLLFFNAILLAFLKNLEIVNTDVVYGEIMAVIILGFILFQVLIIYQFKTENLQQRFVHHLLASIYHQRFMKVVLENFTEGVIIFDEKGEVCYTNPRFIKMVEAQGDFSSLATTELIFPFEAQKTEEATTWSRVRAFFGYLAHNNNKQTEPSRTPSFKDELLFKPRDSTIKLAFSDLLASEALVDGIFEMPAGPEAPAFVKIEKTSINFDKRMLSVFYVVDVSSRMECDLVKQQNGLLSILNATISHELRNPLNAIVGQNLAQSYIIKEIEKTVTRMGDSIDAESLKCSLKRLNHGREISTSSAQMMSFLVQDFLDYAQIKACKFRTQSKPFDLREVITQVMQIQQQRVADLGIDLRADYSAFHGDDGEAIIVNTDQQRLMQVLLNLQSNALKFTKHGSVTIRPAIEETSDCQYLRVSVADTGVGIPYADQGKLFKLFGFLESTECMNNSGVGLGLVISQKIVRQLGGEIEFQSKPFPEEGHGTIFSFSLKLGTDSESSGGSRSSIYEINRRDLVFQWKPALHSRLQTAYDVDIEEETPAPQPTQQKSTMNLWSNSRIKLLQQSCEPISDISHFQHSDLPTEETGPHVLIVDDQQFNIDALKNILELKFRIPLRQVHSATDGEGALALIQSSIDKGRCPYRIIFMDCNMPFMDGFEATIRIRELLYSDLGLSQSKQPVISALTGHGEPEFIKKCFACGMNQVLSKPVEVEALEYVLEQTGVI